MSYPALAEGLVNMDCTNCDWCFWHSDWSIIKGPGGFGSWRMSGNHPNDSIIEDVQNTEKSPGDLRRLPVTQTPVKNYQLTLTWKTLKEYIIMIIVITYICYDLIGRFSRRYNLSRAILCLKVREVSTMYAYISFLFVVSLENFNARFYDIRYSK